MTTAITFFQALVVFGLWFVLAIGIALLWGAIASANERRFTDVDYDGAEDAIERLRLDREAENERTRIAWTEYRKRMEDSARRVEERRRVWAERDNEKAA